MSSTGGVLLVVVVAALLLTATPPADAHPFFRGRSRWSAWWQRRHSPTTTTPTTPPRCSCGAPSAAAAAAEDVPPVPYPVDCVTPLAALGTCVEYLMGISGHTDAPAPGSDCCAVMARFFDSATVAGGGGLSQLRCLCPIISGDVNRFIQKPIDPLQVFYLPTACGVAVPPLVIPLCLNASSRWVTN